MSRITAFSPVVSKAASVMILGSIPGVASLLAQEYYAHPRNAFWPIMERLFAISVQWPYQERLQSLADQGFVLWDVLKSCNRPGSLDSAIDDKTLEVNDFESVLEENRGIQVIYFNGRKAEQLFRKNVLSSLPAEMADIELVGLPSTSPANARMRLEEKIRCWSVIREHRGA